MSHFSRVRTKLKDIETVKDALEDLGYMVREDAIVQGYSRFERAHADLVIEADDGRDVGFKQRNGEVEIVADFWNRQGFDREAFIDKVTQRYAYRTIISKAEEQGFSVITEENQEDGSIRVVVQRW